MYTQLSLEQGLNCVDRPICVVFLLPLPPMRQQDQPLLFLPASLLTEDEGEDLCDDPLRVSE